MSVVVEAEPRKAQLADPAHLAPTEGIYKVTPDEAGLLTQSTAPLDDVDINTESEWYCKIARRAARNLPERLKDALEDFSDVGSRTGALVLRGVDVGRVQSTPPDNSRAVGRHTLMAREAAVLIEHIAEIVGYQAEANGSLQQDMVPNRAKQFAQESQGSRVPLEAHTEQCFSELRPDYVVLACLRGDPAAATYTFTAKQLVSHLTEDEAEMLRQPLWTSLIDSSFQPFVPNPREVRGPFSILSGSQEDPVMLVDQDLMHGITSEAQQLLQKVIVTYEQHRNAHVLQRGDILILDNLRAMHGRSAFRPQYDGGDRFIVRSMAVRDLRRLSPGRRGRLVLSEYS